MRVPMDYQSASRAHGQISKNPLLGGLCNHLGLTLAAVPTPAPPAAMRSPPPSPQQALPVAIFLLPRHPTLLQLLCSPASKVMTFVDQLYHQVGLCIAQCRPKGWSTDCPNPPTRSSARIISEKGRLLKGQRESLPQGFQYCPSASRMPLHKNCSPSPSIFNVICNHDTSDRYISTKANARPGIFSAGYSYTSMGTLQRVVMGPDQVDVHPSSPMTML